MRGTVRCASILRGTQSCNAICCELHLDNPQSVYTYLSQVLFQITLSREVGVCTVQADAV